MNTSLVKNNLKALAIHVVINFISFFMLMTYCIATPKWASEEAAIRHHNHVMNISYRLIAVMLLIYFISAKIILKKQDKIYKNFLSPIIILIIGLVYWLTGFAIHTSGTDLYTLYLGYSSVYLSESGTSNKYIYLLFTFLPSIVMALGMIRIKKEKDHE